VSILEFLAVKPCKYDAYEAIPKRKVSLDLDECERVLEEKGYEILSNPKVMLVVRKGSEITIYPRGRLLMHPVKERDEAEKLARELYEALGK
jgi:ArsR family metal-binding transcriptional regulator